MSSISFAPIPSIVQSVVVLQHVGFLLVQVSLLWVFHFELWDFFYSWWWLGRNPEFCPLSSSFIKILSKIMFGQLKWLRGTRSAVFLPTRPLRINCDLAVTVHWITIISETKSPQQCSIEFIFCGTLTSRGCCSQHDPSSATQGRSPLRFEDFRRDQTRSPPSSLQLLPSGSSALWIAQSSGMGSYSGPQAAAGSSSSGCCPSRSGPVSGTECRTPLHWRVRGPLV